MFDVSGVKGTISFEQLSPSKPTTIALSLIGLTQFPGESFDWKILSTPVASLPQSCQRQALDGIHVFDPLGAIAALGSNYSNECMRNQSLCAVGDLNGKHGQLNSTVQNVMFDDNSVTLFGSRSVVGCVVVIYLPGDSLACANIAFPENSVSAIAPFRNIQNMFLGNIWFREVMFSSTSSTMDQTAVFADLFIASTSGNSMRHNWHVHDNPVGNGSMCAIAGPHYDPEGRFLVANYSLTCSPLNQSACEIGDLSGKSSPLDFTNGVARLFYQDTNLPLVENSEGFSITNRSVVVHEENGGPARVACADVGVLPRRRAIASFDVDGVVGQILFEQATPFDGTSVSVQLIGLEGRAEGYHIHETPVGATQTDCEVEFTGGYFDPWLVGGSPTGNFTTSDDYKAGDLSGKFEELTNQSSVNDRFTDPFIPLFGRDGIIGRSIAIHRPGRERWVCANVTHLQPTVTLVATFNSSEVQGQVVFTQLREDPLSEAAIFVEFFQVDIPFVTPSASSIPSTRLPVTLSSLSTTSDTQPMSQPSDFVMPSVTRTTLETATSTERMVASSTLPTPITSTTTTAIAQASSTIISEEMMTFSETQLPSSSTEQPPPSLLPSSTVDEMATPSLTPSPALSTTVSLTSSTSSSDRLSRETTSSLGSNPEPTPSLPPVDRRKRAHEDLPADHAGALSTSRHKRQSLPVISWSVRPSCNSSPPASPSECGPSSPFACSPGDLDGKHGQLEAAGPLRRVLTDPFLPLSGDQSGLWACQCSV